MNPRRLAAAVLLTATAGIAHAHKASDAYLSMKVDGADVTARVDIALRDLDRDLDLDTDADDSLTWREVRSRWRDIEDVARAGIRLEADGRACALDPAEADAGATPDAAPAITSHSDGHYAVLHLHWHCAAPMARLGIDYTVFAHTDPTHRGIVRLATATASVSGPGQLAVLSPGAGWHRFTLARPAAAQAALVANAPASEAARLDAAHLDAPPGAMPAPRADARRPGAGAIDETDAPPASFPGFVREGIHHILIGYDHILFLLSLLLPAVWVRRTDAAAGTTRWMPAARAWPALVKVLKVVTAFTVAHSITLALSALDVVNPPSRWVESTIAASVVLAALNNLWPVISEARWKLAFVFGLVHGFGFASALKDAGLARGEIVVPLVGFNVGVEIGQLCIVALVLPVAWSLRGTRAYRGAYASGSLAIAAVAALWLTQRAFDLSIIAG